MWPVKSTRTFNGFWAPSLLDGLLRVQPRGLSIGGGPSFLGTRAGVESALLRTMSRHHLYESLYVLNVSRNNGIGYLRDDDR